MTHHDDTIELQRLAAQEELILDATEAITNLLLEQGVTRKELARRLGKTKGFVSHLLSGERNMTLRSLADMAFVLGRKLSIDASRPATWAGHPSAPEAKFAGRDGTRRARPAERPTVHHRREELAATVAEGDLASLPDSHECALAA